MSNHHFQAVIQQLQNRFADIPHLDQQLSPMVISNEVITLPSSIENDIRAFARAYEELTENEAFIESLPRPEGLTPSKAKGAFTSFDFHIVQGQPKLIEINTNAAFYLLAEALAKTHGLVEIDENRIVEMFLREYKEVTGRPRPRHIAIVDDNVSQQALRIEFYLYQSLFRRFGFDASVIDTQTLAFDERKKLIAANHPSSPSSEIDLVYCRDTDFYYEQPRSVALRDALASGAAITPNAWAYYLYADKDRLAQICSDQNTLFPQYDDLFHRVVPQTFDVESRESDEQLWSLRKNLFFKPKNSFGSKAVYHGKSMSRKVFEMILSHPYVAQEYCPPSEVPVETPEGPLSFRYDIRAYSYRGEIQLFTARLFRGQAVNFREPFGGLAPVSFQKL